MEIASQKDYVYQLLLSGRSITSYDAMTKHGIGGLRARIAELILDYNVPIKKQMEPNANNKGYHVRYSMTADDILRLRHTPLNKIHELIK